MIDDDESFRGATLRLLRAHGIDAHGAASVAALTALFPLAPEACVLCDIMIPSGSGLTLPKLLAEHDQSAPLVFISATYDEDALGAATRLSGRPCLRKPIEGEELLAAIRVVGGDRMTPCSS